MNMVRNLLTVFCFGMAAALWFLGPESWTWADVGGPYVVEAIRFCIDAKPFSVLIFCVLGLTLFMTRTIY